MTDTKTLADLDEGDRFRFTRGYIKGIWIVGLPDAGSSTGAPRCYREGSPSASSGEPFWPGCQVTKLEPDEDWCPW